MFVRPWNKESEKILWQLSKNNGRAYSINNQRLPREFGMKYKNLIDNNLLDIATVRNRKEHKTLFVTPPDITVIPKLNQRGINFYFKRHKIL